MPRSFPISSSHSLARILVFLWSPGLPFSVPQRNPPGLATWLCPLQVVGSVPTITDPEGQTTLPSPHFLILCVSGLTLRGSNLTFLGSGDRKGTEQRGPRRVSFYSKRIRNICLLVCLDLYLFILYMCVYMSHVCAMPVETRRGHWCPRN